MAVLHSDYVQLNWKNLFSADRTHLDLVLDYLVTKHASFAEQSVLALSSLLRTDWGEPVVSYLVSKLQRYPAPPVRDAAATTSLLLLQSSDAVLEQGAVVAMLVYVSHERAALLWPFLPAVLHGAVVHLEQDPFMSFGAHLPSYTLSRSLSLSLSLALSHSLSLSLCLCRVPTYYHTYACFFFF